VDAAAGHSAHRAFRRERRQAAARWLAAALVAALAVAALSAGRLLVTLLLAGTAAVVLPRRDPGRWRRGADGERATAVLLQRLPQRRWVVRHDLAVPGSRSNIDHLVIGPTGVWVVDSKAYRGKVESSWRRVTAAGRPVDTGPAAWEAEVVGRRLGVDARPVVVIHGDGGLPRRGRRCAGVRVVPDRSLVRRIRRGQRRLSRRQVEELARRAGMLLPPAAGR
jgi:hypothetical protein